VPRNDAKIRHQLHLTHSNFPDDVTLGGVDDRDEAFPVRLRSHLIGRSCRSGGGVRYSC